MSFSYSGNPSDSDLDGVRFLTSDTDETDALLSNEEIAFLLAQYSSRLYKAAAAACRAIAAKVNRDPTLRTAVATTPMQAVDRYLALATEYDETTAGVVGGMFAGGLTVDAKKEVRADTSLAHTAFTVDMHETPTDTSDDL